VKKLLIFLKEGNFSLSHFSLTLILKFGYSYLSRFKSSSLYTHLMSSLTSLKSYSYIFLLNLVHFWIPSSTPANTNNNCDSILKSILTKNGTDFAQKVLPVVNRYMNIPELIEKYKLYVGAYLEKLKSTNEPSASVPSTNWAVRFWGVVAISLLYVLISKYINRKVKKPVSKSRRASMPNSDKGMLINRRKSIRKSNKFNKHYSCNSIHIKRDANIIKIISTWIN